MSNMINIRRDVQDLFYRYKMPKIQSKIEGKGNGIKTVVPNMVDVAKALNRPASYITKFFGAELGALSMCDEKALKYLVNGAHDAEKLQSVLDGFIIKFVLCQKCDNPETNLSISKKDGTIYRSCQACGFKGQVDMAHKLCTFIRAHPPPKPPKKTQAKDRAGDTDELANKMNEKETPLEGMVAPEDFDDSLINIPVKVDEDDWAEESAAAARQDELSSLSENVRNKLSLGSGSTELDTLDAFGSWLEENKNATNEDIMAQIEDREIKTDKAVAAVIQVLFLEDFAKIFKIRMPLLELLVTSEKEQKALLGSFERLVGVVKIEFLTQISMILQALYSNDLVDEEALFTWRENPSKKYASKEISAKVRAKAKPFFEWLEEAESDDDDDEEDEE